MLLDRDTYQLDVLASLVPTRCVLAQVAVGNDWHPRAPGGHPPGINSLQGVGFIALVPLFRRMLMGPKEFFGPSGRILVGFPSCTLTHPKNGLVPHLYAWWGHITNTLK